MVIAPRSWPAPAAAAKISHARCLVTLCATPASCTSLARRVVYGVQPLQLGCRGHRSIAARCCPPSERRCRPGARRTPRAARLSCRRRTCRRGASTTDTSGTRDSAAAYTIQVGRGQVGRVGQHDVTSGMPSPAKPLRSWSPTGAPTPRWAARGHLRSPHRTSRNGMRRAQQERGDGQTDRHRVAHHDFRPPIPEPLLDRFGAAAVCRCRRRIRRMSSESSRSPSSAIAAGVTMIAAAP